MTACKAMRNAQKGAAMAGRRSIKKENLKSPPIKAVRRYKAKTLTTINKRKKWRFHLLANPDLSLRNKMGDIIVAT
jgi:hypothetical protein